jgi:hypothetical protein
MRRKLRSRLFIAAIVIGVLMIPLGVGWIIYTVTQTGHYDPNAEVQTTLAGGGFTTSRGAYVSSSAWPFVGFALTFAGSIVITVASFGLFFGWFAGSDEDDDRPSPQSMVAHAVPTTTVGWGSAATPAPGTAPGTAPGGG